MEGLIEEHKNIKELCMKKKYKGYKVLNKKIKKFGISRGGRRLS